MRKEIIVDYQRNLDEREVLVKDFTKKENKNETL